MNLLENLVKLQFTLGDLATLQLLYLTCVSSLFILVDVCLLDLVGLCATGHIRFIWFLCSAF